MSHVTTIDSTEIYDIPALKQMCKNEGWEFIDNKKTYAWFGRHVGDYPLPVGFKVEEMGKCDHAIQIPGCSYEIGVVKKNNEWKLIYDFWSSGGLKQKLCSSPQDTQAGLLKQAYGIAKAQVACKQNHKSWVEKPVQNRAGWKKLVVTVGGW